MTAGVVGAAVAIVQLRHGIVPLLDTVTYWSGAESVASGRVFETSLAPSFSNFDAVEFLGRGGHLPFVDFPVLYPLLAGSIGVVSGTRAAMHILAVASIFLVCSAIVRGAVAMPVHRRWALAFFAILVAFLPAMRLVTQGTLSEPLFVATALLTVVHLGRFRNGANWAPVPALIIAGSLLRFLGAPLALLAGWEYFGRTRRLGRSLVWTAAMLAPATTNIVLASAAGGGHNAGWRGLDRVDIDIFVRSVGGWFDGVQGDIRRTYFTNDGPSWWSWILAIAVLGSMAAGTLAVVRRRRLFTDTADLALASAAILTIGLIAGMLGFDALVIADNRLMLPAGILVLSAAVWTACERWRSTPRGTLSILVAITLWGVVAVRPWNALERFSDISRPLVMSQAIVDLDIDLDIVVSNDADGVHWDTGIPAAYTPMGIKPLTGEAVNDSEIYSQLPCALLEANGGIVISNEATFSTVDRSALDVQAASGHLTRMTTKETTVYLPTGISCSE